MRKNRGESEQFLWTLLYCALLEATVNASFGASVAGNSLSKDEEGKNGYRQVATKSIPLIAHELSLAASEGLHRSNLLALNPTKRTDAARYPPLQPYLRPSRSLILHASWPSSASPSPQRKEGLLDFLTCEICFGRLNATDPPVTAGDGVSVCRSCFQRKRDKDSHGESNSLESWGGEVDRLALVKQKFVGGVRDGEDDAEDDADEDGGGEETRRIVRMRGVDCACGLRFSPSPSFWE